MPRSKSPYMISPKSPNIIQKKAKPAKSLDITPKRGKCRVQKKFTGAPFGVSSTRFDVAGVHPKAKGPGRYTEVAYVRNWHRASPASYTNPVGSFTHHAYNQCMKGPNWTRAIEVERESRKPSLLHRASWVEKRAAARMLGPGTYNFRDGIQLMKARPQSRRGPVATRDKRFNKRLRWFQRWTVPGPGTYMRDAIPRPEEYAEPKKRTKGLMRNGGEPLRFEKDKGSHLPPGLYSHQTMIQRMKKRVVSLKGPYELFSGDRQAAIKTGHYAHQIATEVGPGEYKYQTCMEELMNHPHKGKISTRPQHPDYHTERIFLVDLVNCHKEPNDPGPAYYSPIKWQKPLTISLRPPAFFCKVTRGDKMTKRLFNGNFNYIGPGRYNTDKWQIDRYYVDGHKYVFNSVTQRTQPKDFNQAQNDRIRPLNITVDRRKPLVNHESVESQLVKRSAFIDRGRETTEPIKTRCFQLMTCKEKAGALRPPCDVR